MKKIIVLITLLLLTGCTEKLPFPIKESIFEYSKKVILSDIIDSDKIENANQEIDTMKLGKQEIKITYREDDKIKHGKVTIEIIDKEPPKIFNATKYYTKVGEDIDLIKRVIYGDNASREVKIKIVGKYDIHTIGEYPLRFVATDDSGNQKVEEFTLKVVQEYPDSSKTSDIKMADFIKKNKTNKTSIGIDVSVWQGDIDFEKVKQSGVEFVIIRMGYGHKNGENLFDSKFIENFEKAKAASIPVGIYFYSYAKTEEEAIDQAKWIVENLDGQSLELPIAFDWEIWEQFSSLHINFVDLNKIGTAFLDTVEQNGYKGILYGSSNYLKTIWNLPQYPTWLAHYTEKTTYQKEYQMWQASDHGIVDGIKGNVDLNVLYK